jgi:hypothetical protein
MAIYRSRAMPRRNPQSAAKAQLKHEMSRVVQHPLYDALTSGQKDRFQEAYLRARLTGQDVSAAVGTGMRAATSARSNPNDHRTYMAAKKAAGWPYKKALAGWKAKKARAAKAEKKKKAAAREQARADRAAAKDAAKIEKNVVDVAMGEIYHLANRLFPRYQDSLGHWHDGSDFIHETVMFEVDPDRKQIAADLYRSRDTKTKKGWSSANVDSPEFVKGLRQIQKKYKPHGLKMTVAVSNPARSNPSKKKQLRAARMAALRKAERTEPGDWKQQLGQKKHRGWAGTSMGTPHPTPAWRKAIIKFTAPDGEVIYDIWTEDGKTSTDRTQATVRPLHISNIRADLLRTAVSPKGYEVEVEEIDVAEANPSKRQRKKVAGRTSWKVFHADHGISTKQMDYIKKFLLKSMPQGFSIQQFTLPRSLGAVPNAMYGPAAGDGPVPESQVHYMDRSGRGWEDRMVDLPPRPVNYGQVIGIREGNAFTLFTVYGGPLAPQNAADPGNHDVAGSKKFWKQHALSSHQWAKANTRRRTRR